MGGADRRVAPWLAAHARDGRVRWRRRLDGLAADYRFASAEVRREEPSRLASPDRARSANLPPRAFALPIIDALAAWPVRAPWGDWLGSVRSACPARAPSRPDRVLQTLADLRPMADVGPVTLEEARDVFAIGWSPRLAIPRRRYGRVFVGTPHQARGRTFRVVFVPGLAERVVPQRPREDPLLLDDAARDQSTRR